MSWPSKLDDKKVNLFVEGRISKDDAERQRRTAHALLDHLKTQPGVVLADEVGMGKTFVALAIAVAALWSDEARNPVVIMVPSGVRKKWQGDWDLFKTKCLTQDTPTEAISIDDGLQFFRLIDDKPKNRSKIIILSHGAFYRNLRDAWVKFAVIKMAMHHAKLGDRRTSLPRFAARIIQKQSGYDAPDLYERLLQVEFEDWRSVIMEFGEDPGADPVPKSIVRALRHPNVSFAELREELFALPIRESDGIDARIKAVRQRLNVAVQGIWDCALRQAHFHSPLLILDEAHHVKNPQTKLASLFVSEDAEHDRQLLSGALEGGFERMLFLTATPFQLGHNELLSVISRFGGIDWSSIKNTKSKDGLDAELRELETCLNEAQRAALELNWQWGKLRHSDFGTGKDADLDADSAWKSLDKKNCSERMQHTLRAVERTRVALRNAEQKLRPWVVRHLRSRQLSGTKIDRRVRLIGSELLGGKVGASGGLDVRAEALLPFLLAARVQSVLTHIARERADPSVYRATFVDGLASSYETFLETSKGPLEADEAEGGASATVKDKRLSHYLGKLRGALPDERAFKQHPKIDAVVRHVTDLWAQGEKVVVFCHYRVTARVLVKHISSSLKAALWRAACVRSKMNESEARKKAKEWSDALLRDDRPLGRVFRKFMTELLEPYSVEEADRERLVEVARRFVRTPWFFARHVNLAAGNREKEFLRCLQTNQPNTQGLREHLKSFVQFFCERLTEPERQEYLDALERIHPGSRKHEPEPGEVHDTAADLSPTVRAATGAVSDAARRRLLLGFNTPFFPEVLVASSVMAEGVDLHLNCRHIIHHDLDWNPSVLEQRTGRVDRIGAKTERVKASIEVCLPYIGGTQDEKKFRVVTDRERWFSVVMGEKYDLEDRIGDEAAERIPLPKALARELTLRLAVTD